MGDPPGIVNPGVENGEGGVGDGVAMPPTMTGFGGVGSGTYPVALLIGGYLHSGFLQHRGSLGSAT